MVKKTQFVLVCFLMISSISYGSEFGHKDKGKYVVIYYINKNTETIADVGCNEFIESFGNRLSKRIISNKDSLAGFEELIGNVKFTSRPSRSKSINVRCQMKYFKDQELVATVCIGNYGKVEINGRYARKNRRLKRFLMACYPSD